MLNFRVQIASNYIPTMLYNRGMTFGCLEKDMQASFKYFTSQSQSTRDNHLKPDHLLRHDNLIRTMSIQQHNTIYQYMLTDTPAFSQKYRTYSTDAIKDKKLTQKEKNKKVEIKIQNITGVRPELISTKPLKIMQDESVLAPGEPIILWEVGPVAAPVEDVVQKEAVPTEPVESKTYSQPQPVTLSPKLQQVTMQSTSSPFIFKNDLLFTNQKSSLEFHRQMSYTDLSSVTVPIPLHQADENESIFFNAMVDELRKFQEDTSHVVVLISEQGTFWYIAAKNSLTYLVVKEILMRGNQTTKSIANKMLILLTEKEVAKNVEKAADKAAEKAKEVSKTAADIVVDKIKTLVDTLKEIAEKLKKKS